MPSDFGKHIWRPHTNHRHNDDGHYKGENKYNQINITNRINDRGLNEFSEDSHHPDHLQMLGRFRIGTTDT
eukprot:4056177-Karenia_brevis.AAC.1